MSESETHGSGGVAIVTGGRRGIGKGICMALAKRGFTILVVDLEEDASARETGVKHVSRALFGVVASSSHDERRAWLEEAGRMARDTARLAS